MVPLIDMVGYRINEKAKQLLQSYRWGDVKELCDGLSIEQRAIRKELELHDLAVESMSYALTGLCEVKEDYECCTWILKYLIIINQTASTDWKVSLLQAEARDIGKDGWNPFK